MYPTEYRYSKEHEWVAVEGDVATIGITDFAQGELGDIVYVELPEVGGRVKRGQPIGLVEVMKTFNQILYDGPGFPDEAEVVEIRAEDAQEVGVGQILIVVR